MKRKESHARVNALSDLFDKLVVDLFVIGVSPPHKDVGIVKKLVCYSLVGIVESCKSNFDIIALKLALEICVQTVGVYCFYCFFRFFVSEFVPKCNFDGHRNLQKDIINKLYNKTRIKSIYKTTKNQLKKEMQE